ncbi:MAG TPA: hypothetical protein VGJ64_04430 [Gemmatimonadaceae bacterium]
MLRVAIPGGVWSDDAQQTGEPLREVALRPVGGEDEAFLLDVADHAVPSERATALLTRCLDVATADKTARALTVGDREALLLHLRRLTLGETFDCVLRCPADQCGEQMEFELRVADLLVPAYDDVRQVYELGLDADGARYEISFRLPTAADLDHAAMFAAIDAQRGAYVLLERCVVRALRDHNIVSVDALAPVVRDAISAAMAERDPQAEIELELECPACGTAFSIVFDTAMFFLQELDERAAQLTQEVHTLALHYHWSEREIMQMPRRRRTRYLELVSGAVARKEHP